MLPSENTGQGIWELRKLRWVGRSLSRSVFGEIALHQNNRLLCQEKKNLYFFMSCLALSCLKMALKDKMSLEDQLFWIPFLSLPIVSKAGEAEGR